MPPVVHVVGAVACGPKTVNVSGHPRRSAAPDSVELIELGPIAVPAPPVAGAATVVLVEACTIVVVWGLVGVVWVLPALSQAIV